jgi:hypothetical protein
MANEQEPVVLELAPLPREQIGPFLLLGVDRAADEEQIQSHWAQRVIRARKNQSRVALGDINWARETVRDPQRRVLADLASLNVDTAAGTLGGLAQGYGLRGGQAPPWQPLEAPGLPAGTAPATEVPDAREVRAGMSVPELPPDLPAVHALVEQLVREPLDPWALPER